MSQNSNLWNAQNGTLLPLVDLLTSLNQFKKKTLLRRIYTQTLFAIMPTYI